MITSFAVWVLADRLKTVCHIRGYLKRSNGHLVLHFLQRGVTQLFCLNDESLKRNTVKCGEILHGPQGGALLPTL